MNLIKKIIKKLDDDLEEKSSLKALARTASVSPKEFKEYFQRLFVKEKKKKKQGCKS